MCAVAGRCGVNVVNALSGRCMSTLCLPSSAEVRDVKRALESSQSISVLCQRLILGSTCSLLNDSDTLGSLVLDKDSNQLMESIVQLTVEFVRIPYSDDVYAGRRLMDAAREGPAEVLEQLLRKPTWPNYTDALDRTSLHIAASAGRHEAVRALCEAGAQKDMAMRGGATALFLAARHGHADVVRELCEAGANKDKANDAGATPLFAASESGHFEVVQLLCAARADVAEPTHYGMTALFMAMRNGHHEIVAVLSREVFEQGKARRSALVDWSEWWTLDGFVAALRSYIFCT